MIVSSFGSLQAYETEPFTTWALSDPSAQAPGVWIAGIDNYAMLYRTQPAVRTCVDFLARNTAQLGRHVYRRVSDTDRARLRDHDLARWLDDPNPSTTGYRLIEAMVQDFEIYWRAYWMKYRRTDGDLGLWRLPPAWVTTHGVIAPTAFTVTWPNGEQDTLRPEQVVYFAGYDPTEAEPLSPLETLRKRLAEESAAVDYRERYWANAARLEGVIERPITAPKWTPKQKADWREQFSERFVGHPGQVAVLEDGMTWKQISQSWQESEYTQARKLMLEEVARAYHIPAPMVGILDHATYSNIRELHKQLYQDCLGPLLRMIEKEIMRQLLVESADQEDVYVEFNIAEKLSGSFEEQSVALQRLVGRPIMTANEGRAKLNLPAIQDDATADALVLPLNQASSGGTTTGQPLQPAEPGSLAANQLQPILQASFARQWSLLRKVDGDDRPRAFQISRWDRELTEDLLPLFDGDAVQSAALAERINTETLRRLTEGVADPFAGREAA